MISWLLAQAGDNVTNVAGGVSLVGTIINGSVLVWLLLVHLPAKDKLIRDLLSEKDKQLADKDQRFDAQVTFWRGALEKLIAAESQSRSERLKIEKDGQSELLGVLHEEMREQRAFYQQEAAAQREECLREINRWASLWEKRTGEKL